jgi:6-phospho-beta-glucosidase
MKALTSGAGNVAGAASTQLILNTRNSAVTGEDAGEPAIPGLPADAVVEVPCTVTHSGAVPIPQAPPAAPQLELMQRVKQVERLTVRAAAHGDRDAALEAFAEHPLVDSTELAGRLLAGYETAFPGLASHWRRE